MLTEVSLNQYRIFYAAAQCGSISKAAEKLYISQPAISRAVHSLEESLGTRLFRREHRGVTLTEEGELLYGHLRNAFAEISTAEERIRELTEGDSGHLRIGTSAVLCKNMLLPYLKGFAAEHPKIKITIECRSSRLTGELLESGAIDAALMVRPSSAADISFYSLGEIRDTFVAAPSFLSGIGYENGKSLSSEEFGKLIERAGGIMLLDKTNGTRRHIDRFFKENKIAAERSGIIEVSGMDMLIEFALTGLGIACVIESFVNEDIIGGRLSEIRLKNTPDSREVGFAVPSKGELSRSAGYFMDFVREYTPLPQ
ncbi:MAG: LysR family transcriptional regulator [Oscillospiraceae bacterium]